MRQGGAGALIATGWKFSGRSARAQVISGSWGAAHGRYRGLRDCRSVAFSCRL